MDESIFFAEQFRATLAQMSYMARLVPVARRYLRPPFQNAEWSAAREVYHLALYEESVALPSMRLWLGGPPVDDSTFLHEDALWESEGQQIDYSALLRRLADVREEQIALLPSLAGLWDEPRETVWTAPQLEARTLQWVVAKTLQHTCEHISAVARIALFWDHVALHYQREEASTGE